ncbi:glycoside hydrolase family 26 protein [Thalassiella azotivora]
MSAEKNPPAENSTPDSHVWSGPADVVGAAAAHVAATSVRTRLVALGLVAAMAATTLVIWGSPSLRSSLDDAVDGTAGAVTASDDLAESISDRDDSEQRAQRSETRSTLTALAAALTAADRETAADLARQVIAASGDDPKLEEMLADIGLTPEQLWRVAGAGTAKTFDELLVEVGYDGQGGQGGRAGQGSGGSSGSPGSDASGAGWHGGASGGTSGNAPGTSPAGRDSSEYAKRPAQPAPAPDPACWQFTWQQDAQAAYVKDLNDPYGLDGNPGPRDDDGIACRDLPDDPNRAASIPAGAFEPTAPPVQHLLDPARTFFGVHSPQAPYFFGEVEELAQAIDHVPSSVTYFAGWDQDFRPDAADAAWTRNMFPIIAWEARPNETDMGPGSNNAVNEDYQLADIIEGDHDEYLRQYAQDVAEYGLPVGIRLNHEMNGIWYPWAEQVNGNQPGEYVAAWRHVHDVFTEAGADNVLWIWSPNVIEFPQAQPLEELYPGDEYVDFTGLVGYYRKPIEGKEASFQNTYGKSVAKLREVAPGKPIWLTEVGATEQGGNKVDWVTSFFEAMEANPDIKGITWFQREVTAIPIGEKDPVTNDWRITSSPEVTAVARQALDRGGFSAGTAPRQPLPAPIGRVG